MSLPVVDWFTVLFFLAALILVARLRQPLVAVDSESYGRISIGLGLLSLVALARLYASLGILDGVPFFSEPIFFQLIVWVIVITGVTFLVSGVAGWLPLARASREADRLTISRLTLFRELEQLGSIEPRPEPFFQAALSHVIEAHSFSAGAIFTVSARGDRVELVGSVNCGRFESALSDVTLQPCAGDTGGMVQLAGLGLLSGLPEELASPVLVLPVEVQNRVRGFFLFWGPVAPDVNAVLDLKLVADIIARRILHRSRQIKIDFFESVERLYLRLNEQLATPQTPTERLNTLIRELRPLVPIDFGMLLIPMNTENRVDRLWAGAGGQMLHERGVLPGPALTALLHDTLSSGTLVSSVGASLADELREELPGQLESVAIVSMPLGQLVLGAARRNVYTPAVLRAIEYVAPHVLTALNEYRSQQSTELLQRRFSDLIRLSVAKAGDRVTALAGIASFLKDVLRVDSVRISFIDEAGLFLNSVGLASTTVGPSMAPATGSMILELLPLHERAITSGEIEVWDDDDGAEPVSESELPALSPGNVESLVVVPITRADTARGVVGTITIVSSDTRSCSLLTESNRILLQTTAALLSGETPLDHRTKKSGRRPRLAAALTGLQTEQRSYIRSSLTGILGSVELMRSLKSPDPDTVQKFLNIIDRSAHRIDTYVTAATFDSAAGLAPELSDQRAESNAARK